MATPGFVFVKTSSMETHIGDTPFKIYVPNSRAGNCLMIFFQSATAPSADPTATDNIGTGTWAVAKGVVGGQRLTALVQMNCPAGVNTIDLTLQAADSFTGYTYAEAYNVSQAALASALDGTPVSATGISGSPVAAGSINTGSADSLVIQFGSSTSTLADNVYTNGSGFTALSKQRSSQVNSAATWFVQYQVKTSPGAINPTYTLTGSATSDTLAFALKSAAAGSAPPAGMRVVGALGCNVVANQTSLTVDFPHVGNLIHVSAEGSEFAISTITDGDGNSYVGENNSIPGLAVGHSSWRAINVNPNTDLAGIVITWAGSNVQPGFVELFDVVGAAAVQGTNDRVQTVSTSGNQSSAGDVDFGTITPQTPDGLIIGNFGIESHTVSGMTSPTPANGGCANIAVIPAADGAGTTLEEDNLHPFWSYTGLPGATTFTATIQHNTAGIGHWGTFLTEYKASAARSSQLPLLGVG